MKLRLPVVILALAVAAPAAAAQPPKPTHSTDPAHCTWVWQTGAGIGVWTERCALGTGLWQLRFSKAAAGFSLLVGSEDNGTVLRVFAKPADSSIDAILPDLRRRGLVPADDCVFRPATAASLATVGPAPKTRAFFEIMPVGQRKADYDATSPNEVPDPPCGDLGWGPSGVHLFMTDTTHPAGVVYLDLGQDGSMFDPTTVTWQ